MLKQEFKNLTEKVEKSLQVLEEAYERFGNEMAIFYTGGKDSTLLLHMVREKFGSQIPFRIIFLDTGMDFEEVYNFIERTKKLWRFDLLTIEASEKLRMEFNRLENETERVQFASMMKIILLQQAVKEHNLPALVIGIRWDEHKERIGEKFFSEREDHVRIHPLLHFTEDDVWEYIKKNNVPYVDLYDKGYRSLGEKEFTKPAKADGDERSGRAKGREVIMERLRSLGYF